MDPKQTEEAACITYCESAPFSDPEICRQICLSASAANHSQYHYFLLMGQREGLTEDDAHIFAAGAVCGWLKLYNNLRKVNR